MLNLFPIQFLSMFAYLILRITLGFILISLGREHFKKFSLIAPQVKWPFIKNGKLVLGLLIFSELLIGFMFIIGLLTQAVAAACFMMCFKLIIWYKSFPENTLPSKLSLLLIAFISLSLFITGAGALAFDLPI